jgi:hypothetical protein
VTELATEGRSLLKDGARELRAEAMSPVSECVCRCMAGEGDGWAQRGHGHDEEDRRLPQRGARSTHSTSGRGVFGLRRALQTDRNRNRNRNRNGRGTRTLTGRPAAPMQTSRVEQQRERMKV